MALGLCAIEALKCFQSPASSSKSTILTTLGEVVLQLKPAISDLSPRPHIKSNPVIRKLCFTLEVSRNQRRLQETLREQQAGQDPMSENLNSLFFLLLAPGVTPHSSSSFAEKVRESGWPWVLVPSKIRCPLPETVLGDGGARWTVGGGKEM